MYSRIVEKPLNERSVVDEDIARRIEGTRRKLKYGNENIEVQ